MFLSAIKLYTRTQNIGKILNQSWKNMNLENHLLQRLLRVLT